MATHPVIITGILAVLIEIIVGTAIGAANLHRVAAAANADLIYTEPDWFWRLACCWISASLMEAGDADCAAAMLAASSSETQTATSDKGLRASLVGFIAV